MGGRGTEKEQSREKQRKLLIFVAYELQLALLNLDSEETTADDLMRLQSKRSAVENCSDMT